MNIVVSSQAWFRFRQSGHFDTPLAVAALIGGSIGSWWRAKNATPVMIHRRLGVVLAIAGAKPLFP